MNRFFYGVQMLMVVIVAVPAAYGNCYVLENKTNSAIKLQFSYNGSVGLGTVTAVELAPHSHYPARGPWCWNTRGDQWAIVTIDTSAAYMPSWDGQLVLGNGGPAYPSGRYVLNPASRTGGDKKRR